MDERERINLGDDDIDEEDAEWEEDHPVLGPYVRITQAGGNELNVPLALFQLLTGRVLNRGNPHEAADQERPRWNRTVSENSVPKSLQGSELESLMMYESGLRATPENLNLAQVLHQHQEGGTQFIRQPHGAYRLRERPMSLRAQRFFSAPRVPNIPRVVDRYRNTVFCAEYSPDGEMFVTASQDRSIRIYDTRTWKVTKRIVTQDMGWAVLSTDFSPNTQWVAYSGWHNNVHLVNTGGEHEIHEALPFMDDHHHRNALFSVKFSADSRELLGGSKDYHWYLYDIETKQRTHRVLGHSDDINNVAWADNSSQVFFTGSDDRMIKVWDRRIVDNGGKPAGALPGHLHGITYIDSRGDGRYLISNGKDQRIKLWDLRVMATDSEELAARNLPTRGMMDYRIGVPRRALLDQRLVNDVSVMTYTGHGVAETLIRCRFSPSRPTGQKYIYTGSFGGDVVIYDVLTGQIVKRLHGHTETVRDLDWHPEAQTLVTTGWDGRVVEWIWRPHGVEEPDHNDNEVVHNGSEEEDDDDDEDDENLAGADDES